MFSFFKDLLFPAVCLGCGREGSNICATCLKQLRFSGGEILPPPNSPLASITAAGDYRDPLLGEAIRRYKFGPLPELAWPLGDYLSAYLSGQLYIYPELRNFVLTPIPLGHRRRRERGFDQAARLAERVAANLGLPCENCLIRTRDSQPQSSLPARDRRRNLIGAFAWHGHSAANRSFLLLDDVVTTGSTLHEAALVLQRAGAKRIRALALARANPLHFPPGEV